MYVDSNGNFVISALAWIVVGIITSVAVAATVNDIYQITRTDGISYEINDSKDNVKINNSYKIITSWMRYGYSFYLNHFNSDTKDIIQGSSVGVQFEWELHNIAYWFGFGGDSARSLDVGKTIFSDGKNHPLINKKGNIDEIGVMSLAMQVLYVMYHPIYGVWDLIINGGF